MNKIAIIGGSGVLDAELFADLREDEIETVYGRVKLAENERILFLQRHGDPPLPPHRINHHANLMALKKAGVTMVVAVNSTGSLKSTIAPGSLLVPDDYFNPWAIKTYFDDRLEFTTPGLSEPLRRALLAAAAELGVEIIDGGTYVQTTGPRFETRAEVRVLSGWGEIVGMTMANEATLAKELGLEYASICLVDNYANGVCDRTVDIREVETAQRENSRILGRLLPQVVESLRKGDCS
ncbi:MAG: MTAP family purine nucleoside phosphorylase [Deltaproteobacteria bacterium]|nr:MTAP family purine nucleoside phosphorylase [Deltaproteobacteria bacterium]